MLRNNREPGRDLDQPSHLEIMRVILMDSFVFN